MPTCNHDLEYYRQEHNGEAPSVSLTPWSAACQACRDTLVAEGTCLPASQNSPSLAEARWHQLPGLNFRLRARVVQGIIGKPCT